MYLKSLRNLSLLILALLCVSCSPQEERVKGSYTRLISHYDRLLKKDPANQEFKMRYAQLCYTFKDYEKIKEILEGEKSFPARVLRAKACARLHEYTAALEIFGLVEDKLKDPEALYLYALVLEEKNLYPRAVKIYERIEEPFKEKAKARLGKIRVKIEETVPAYIRDLSENARSFSEKVCDEAALILFVDEKEEIKSDNTAVATVHVIEKVLKERGKALAEVVIGYDSTYERVELEFARTITKEDKIVYAGEENIRDVTKYLNFPLYSNAKAFIISMPSVDVGAIIEYKIKIYSAKLINEDDFSIPYRLREQYPIYEAHFELVVPRKKRVNHTFSNVAYAEDISLAPEVKEEGDIKRYTWKFKEITPIIPEYNMPPLSLVNPAVFISSFQTWDEIYRWWHELCRDKFDVNEEMERLIAELTRDASDEYTKAKKIYEYVAQNIRYVGVEYGESGYEPHKASEVFLNRYGDCKDQAILLAALLRAAGLRGFPVLIPTRSAYEIKEEFPSVNFNHAIAAVKLEDRLVFMDPTSEMAAFGDLPVSDQARTVMVFFDNTYGIVKTPQLTNSEIIYTMKIDIDEEENAHIKRVVESKGGYSTYQRWYLKYTHPNKIKQNIENKIVAISPFSKLVNLHIQNVDNFDVSPQLRYEFKSEKLLNPSQNLRIIPPLNEIELDASLIAREERSFPVDFSELSTRKARISFVLPANLKVKYIPRDVYISTKWFDFKINYNEEDNLLDFFQEFVIKERFVTQAEYADFRKEMKEIFYHLREVIILEKMN